MDFNVSSSSRKRAARETALSPGFTFGPGGGASRLSLYKTPPAEEIGIEEFERFALDRLRVLKAVEDARTRGKKPDELDVLVNDTWRKHMRATTPADTARKDAVSHFVLRLAYCRTEELRRWFLAQETAVFRHRFRTEDPVTQRRFMEDNGLPYRAIGAAELEAVREKLSQVARSVNAMAPPLADNAVYYKVPFQEVPELVAGRKVFLLRGMAFVPRDQLASIVVGQFRASLSKALVLTNRLWAAKVVHEEKDRLAPVVQMLSTSYLGPDYSTPSANAVVSARDLDALAQKSFPLCMRHLYYKLGEDHHLRHGGRQQLGLFLKGIGLPLEEALAFWRSQFGQKIGPEKFDKEYAYGVRYNYGKEGKRMDWTPQSCMKIIMSTPGVGDHHGCPYRHFSEENLRAALGGMHLTPACTREVMEKVKGHHYQLACAAAFEGSHRCQSDGVNHPNQYFEQSQKILQPANPEPQGLDPLGTPSTPLPGPRGARPGTGGAMDSQ